MAKKVSATAAAIREKPWGEMTKAEKLGFTTDLGLDIVKSILELGVDLGNLKLLKIVKEAALTVISQQIRVDEGQMRSQQSVQQIAAIVAALDAAAKKEEEAEAKIGDGLE
jgi:hypothetical protein